MTQAMAHERLTCREIGGKSEPYYYCISLIMAAAFNGL